MERDILGLDTLFAGLTEDQIQERVQMLSDGVDAIWQERIDSGEDPAFVAFERDIVDNALKIGQVGVYSEVSLDDLSPMARQFAWLTIMINDPEKHLPELWGKGVSRVRTSSWRIF